MKIEAMKLALEALQYPLNTSHEGFNVDMAELLAHRAIKALEEALAKQEQGEPVGIVESAIQGAGGFHVKLTRHVMPMIGETLYTTPQQRTWVGLTDEEIFEIHKQVDSMQYLTFGKAIEAKLKDKNT